MARQTEPDFKLLEGIAIDVNADNLVAGQTVLRQVSRPAPDLENPAPGSDQFDVQLRSRRISKEILVLPVGLKVLLELGNILFRC